MSTGLPPTASPRDRIVETAFRLFYRQGYIATGVNQLIAESGVAKATFYSHFPQKDELLVVYLREMSRTDIEDVRAYANAKKTPRERFLAPMRMLVPWFKESNYRGCPFQNVVAEAPPSDARVHDIVRQHRENLRALFRELAFDVLQEESSSDGGTPEQTANLYLLLFEGALATAVAYRDPWPVEQAISTLEGILGN